MEKRPWTYLPSLFNPKDSEVWAKRITKNISWEQPLVRVYGKRYLVPRKTSFLAENQISYRYSGISHYGNGWPNWFLPLLGIVRSVSKSRFNGCLLNLYRNGYDRMGWHSDNENELDLSKPIASLSFGAPRDFYLRHRSKNARQLLTLKTGDLLIMHPDCQKEWMHSIPARRKVLTPRVNLTFRCYK